MKITVTVHLRHIAGPQPAVRSQRLGGLGQWNNMMPLTNGANQRHYHAMEKAVINAVATGKKLAWVKVHTDYSGADITAGGAPEEMEKAAESRIGDLEWSCGPAAYANGKWTEAPDTDDFKKTSGSVKSTER